MQPDVFGTKARKSRGYMDTSPGYRDVDPGYKEMYPWGIRKCGRWEATCAEAVYGFRFRWEDERRVVERWVASDERRPTGGDESSSALQAST